MGKDVCWLCESWVMLELMFNELMLETSSRLDFFDEVCWLCESWVMCVKAVLRFNELLEWVFIDLLKKAITAYMPIYVFFC